jgi:RNA polymerase sigma factor (sigma-70 family)
LKRSLRYSDEELLKGLVARDETVLKELYKTYFPGTRRFIMSNQGREEDAYDLFQEALMVLFQKARVQEFKLTCSFGTYLYSVVRFLWLKELEKKKGC